jgi:hypothetical protein
VAHVNVHLALGIAAGTAATMIPVARAWLAGRPLARPVAIMIGLSYALGLWAIAPNILTKLGVHVAGAWWADIFMLHTSLDRALRGGLLVGEVAIAAAFVFHYAVITAAIVRVTRRSGASSPIARGRRR